MSAEAETWKKYQNLPTHLESAGTNHVPCHASTDLIEQTDHKDNRV